MRVREYKRTGHFQDLGWKLGKPAWGFRPHPHRHISAPQAGQRLLVGSPCRTCGSAVVGPQGRWWGIEPSCRLRGDGCLPGRSQRALRGSRQQTGRGGQEGRSPSGRALLAALQSQPQFCPTWRAPMTPTPALAAAMRH